VNGKAAQDTARSLGEGRGIAIACDIADGAAVAAAVEQAQAAFDP
jgi:hypothetical protein